MVKKRYNPRKEKVIEGEKERPSRYGAGKEKKALGWCSY